MGGNCAAEIEYDTIWDAMKLPNVGNVHLYEVLSGGGVSTKDEVYQFCQAIHSHETGIKAGCFKRAVTKSIKCLN